MLLSKKIKTQQKVIIILHAIFVIISFHTFILKRINYFTVHYNIRYKNKKTFQTFQTGSFICFDTKIKKKDYFQTAKTTQSKLHSYYDIEYGFFLPIPYNSFYCFYIYIYILFTSRAHERTSLGSRHRRLS